MMRLVGALHEVVVPEVNQQHGHQPRVRVLAPAAVGCEEALDLGGLEDADVGQSGG
jgi:hypothetical protein